MTYLAHAARKWLTGDLNPSSLTPELKLLNKQIHVVENIIHSTQCPVSYFLSEDVFLWTEEAGKSVLLLSSWIVCILGT